MAPGPEAFAALLARQSREAVLGFVAGLFRARDWTVERDDAAAVLLVTRDGATERVAVAHDPSLARRALARIGVDVRAARSRRQDATVPPGADRLVTTARLPDCDDPDVLDADALRDLALYGISRSACASLFEQSFGVALAAAGSDADARRRRSRGVLVAVGVAALLVVASVAAAGLFLGSGSQAPSDASSGGSAPTDAVADADGSAPVTGTPSGSGVQAEPTATATPSYPEGYPIGLRRDGVTDADALAEAHTLSLLQGSYRWSITYSEVVNDTRQGYVRQTVAVESPYRYRSWTERNGTVRSPTLVVADHPVYADGSNEYRRITEGGTVSYERHGLHQGMGPAAPLYEHPLQVIAWYLSTEESRVVDIYEDGEDQAFRVEGTGDSWPRTTDERTVAVIGDDGVVYYLERRHRPPDWEGRIVVTLRASRRPNLTVSPPAWYPEARNASDGTSTATAS